MDGLIVNQPYANLIINGQKQWELRHRPPPKSKIGSAVYLLSNCKILGKIIIQSSKGPLTFEELTNTIHLHKVSPTKLDDSAVCYVWEITISEKFDVPKKYLHPYGAQIWVKNVLTSDYYAKGKITFYF